MNKKFFTLCALCLAFYGSTSAQNVIKLPQEFAPIADSVTTYLRSTAAINAKIKVDSIMKSDSNLDIWFSNNVSDFYIRDYTINDITNIVNSLLPEQYKGSKLTLHANGSTLEELKSKFYSQEYNNSKKRKVKASKKVAPVLVENLSKPYDITAGLFGKHLAVWQSHGFYYEQKLQRWEWQRARIFQTVEDLYTQSYVVPFLVPMLENAGANVLLPRERDEQIAEVIVDNDDILTGYSENSNSWRDGDSLGFANPKKSYLFGENPFRMGTYRVADGVYNKKSEPNNFIAQWLPNINKSGRYAVYISYKSLPNSTDAAYYTVKYNGGETKFKVNQQIGGGTWIYLGTFPFSVGAKSEGVLLANKVSKKGTVLTADGVKFGGGMGNMARNVNVDGVTENVKSSSTESAKEVKITFESKAEVSGYPRIKEGARYWLQWAGYADSVYSYTNNTNDYTDDYVSRGRWVNTISGGSKNNPEYKGLKVPIDLSFAFHSDAGTYLTDSIVGTLGIYTRYSNDIDTYPNGQSRMAAREMTDIIQTQIVDDIRAEFNPNWSRRGLWDRSYAESRIPNVPSMLLELLSHQNFGDMKYGLDPNFKFTVSRAIYKGMVKYLSMANGGNYVIQPLPVKNMASEFVTGKNGGMAVKLNWSPVNDPLEPTAVPTKYIIYTREGDGGFDNGVVVADSSAVIEIAANKVYGFKVAALNDGGESFPSEILSVGVPANVNPLSDASKTVLVVNGFDRISGPLSFQSTDSTMAGFSNSIDSGVSYINDYSFIGAQHEFRREIPWMDDDAPGFGASYANYESKVIAGNSFDYPYAHGLAFMKQGYAFISTSANAIEAGKASMKGYVIVDIIMGKQVQTKVGSGFKEIAYEVFPLALREAITEYCNGGGNILISGASVASDLWDSHNVTKEGKEFAESVLKYKWMTNYASTDGKVKSVANPFNFKGNFKFVTKPNDKIYNVETPDALVPVGSDSFTIFRYSENNISAGVAYKGEYRSVVLGFPIETLSRSEQLDRMVKEVITFFIKK